MKAMTLYRPPVPTFLGDTLSGIDRYLESFFEDSFLSLPGQTSGRMPRVDVQETDNAYVIEAELPGYDEKALEIRLDGSHLTIESKKEEEKTEEKSPTYLIRERRSSAFSRSFKLPENADTEDIKAVFAKGVLNLRIPKRAEAQRKTIAINSA